MKKLFFLFMTVAMAATMSYAQGKGQPKPKKTPEQRADACANKLEKDLTLNADQKKKVHDLALTRAKKMDELREKYKGQDPKTWQAERKKVRDEFHSGMKSVLSPEQFAKWEEQRKKAAANHAKGKGKPKKGPKGGTPPPPPAPGNDAGDGEDPDLDGE